VHAAGPQKQDLLLQQVRTVAGAVVVLRSRTPAAQGLMAWAPPERAAVIRQLAQQTAAGRLFLLCLACCSSHTVCPHMLFLGRRGQRGTRQPAGTPSAPAGQGPALARQLPPLLLLPNSQQQGRGPSPQGVAAAAQTEPPEGLNLRLKAKCEASWLSSDCGAAAAGAVIAAEGGLLAAIDSHTGRQELLWVGLPHAAITGGWRRPLLPPPLGHLPASAAQFATAAMPRVYIKCTV